MLTITPQNRIYVYTEPADMRKGANGLSAIIRSELEADPIDGSLYVFINKRRDRLKILHFDGGGFWIYYRVLEAGTFESLTKPHEGRSITMDSTELSMLLAGVTLATSGRRRKRYKLSREGNSAA
jgi:transposase